MKWRFTLVGLVTATLLLSIYIWPLVFKKVHYDAWPTVTLSLEGFGEKKINRALFRCGRDKKRLDSTFERVSSGYLNDCEEATVKTPTTIHIRSWSGGTKTFFSEEYNQETQVILFLETEAGEALCGKFDLPDFRNSKALEVSYGQLKPIKSDPPKPPTNQ